MTSWRDETYAVLDLESTGMDPRRHQVLQVGVAEIRGGRIPLGAAWASYVRPLRPFGSETVRVHGLSHDSLQAAPPLPEVRAELAQRLSGRIVVAHYAPLELGFLRRWGLRPRQVLDTLDLGLLAEGERLEMAQRDRYTLPALARRCGVTVYGEHDALADALITAQVFVALAETLERQRGPLGARELQRLSGQGWFLFRR